MDSERTITTVSFWRPRWFGRWSCQECGAAVARRDVRRHAVWHAVWHAVQAGHADHRPNPSRPLSDGGHRRTIHVDKIGSVL